MKYRIEIYEPFTSVFRNQLSPYDVIDTFESDDINEIGDGSDFACDWVSENRDEYDWEEDGEAEITYQVFENDVVISSGTYPLFPSAWDD